MPTPIFPGRFQPFHNGHLMVIQGMMKACGAAVIVIAEALDPRSSDEMFSLDERREMISAALLSADIMDATIVTVKDAPDDAVWAKHVLDAAGLVAEPTVWSGNEEVRAIFEKMGVATKKIVPVPGIVGSEIRELLKKRDGAWRSKVPAGAMDTVTDVLQKMG